VVSLISKYTGQAGVTEGSIHLVQKDGSFESSLKYYMGGLYAVLDKSVSVLADTVLN